MAILGQLSLNTANLNATQMDTAPITWERLNKSCENSPEYNKLREIVTTGFPEDKTQLPTFLLPYYKLRHELSVLNKVVMLHNRPVIPETLRNDIMHALHACHSGANGMICRAQQSVYWPGYTKDLAKFQANCQPCRLMAPSNPHNPPAPHVDLPTYPFQVLCADFFVHNGKNYLIIVDKYSNWLSILKLKKDDSYHVIAALRQYFATFGICETLSTDGALQFTSKEMSDFCNRWGIHQRISSAYYPRSNKRAEVGVKSAKRLIQNNIAGNGDLNTDKFSRALLIHRNAPDPDAGVSPAEIVFGKPIRDHIPALNFSPRQVWADLARKREDSFMKRHFLKSESLKQGCKNLKNLVTGDNVYVQNQAGPSPNKWSKSGTIIEVLPHDSYLVKIHGSNTVTKRNRKFLRQFSPFAEACSDTQAKTVATVMTWEDIPGTSIQFDKTPIASTLSESEV